MLFFWTFFEQQKSITVSTKISREIIFDIDDNNKKRLPLLNLMTARNSA